MRSVHRGSRRVGTARRKLVWSTFDQTLAALAAGAHVNVNLLAELAVAGSSLLGITIMRTHVRFTTGSTGVVTDGLVYGLVVGRALDVGVGVGPNPNTDHDIDWLLIDRYFPVTTGGGAFTDDTQVIIDNRAKRKMQELQQSYLFSVTNTGATAITPRVFARTLVALP